MQVHFLALFETNDFLLLKSWKYLEKCSKYAKNELKAVMVLAIVLAKPWAMCCFTCTGHVSKTISIMLATAPTHTQWNSWGGLDKNHFFEGFPYSLFIKLALRLWFNGLKDFWLKVEMDIQLFKNI